MRVLVVTSNPEAAASHRSSVAGALSDLGCEVVAVGYDVDTLPDDIEVRRPTVVVVDAGAHLEVGRAAIRRMREVGSLVDVPVLLCLEASRLTGFDTDVAADDFVLVPFIAPELYARIRLLDWRMSSFQAAGRIKIDDLVIDAVGAEVWYRGRAVKLPRQEFQLLKFLAERPGRAFGRDQLVSRVWGYRYAGETRTVDIHIRRFRRSLRRTRLAVPSRSSAFAAVPGGVAFVATSVPSSLDSRYFGPVPLSALTVARPLWTF